MAAAHWDIVIEEGSQFDMYITLRDCNCGTKDITGWGALFQVVAPDLVYTGSTEDGRVVAGPDGTFHIQLPIEVVNNPISEWERGKWEFIVWDSEGSREDGAKRVLSGRASFSPSVIVEPEPLPPEAQTFFIINSDDQDVFGPSMVDPYVPVLAAGNADLLISRYDETEPGEFTERGDWAFGEPQLHNLVITGELSGSADFLFYAKRVYAGGPLGVVLPFIVFDFDSGHKLYTEKDQGSFYSLVVEQGEEEVFREDNIYIQPQRDMWIEYFGGTLKLINTWNEDETRQVQLSEEIELGALSHVAIGAHDADAYVGFDEFALYAPIEPLLQ